MTHHYTDFHPQSLIVVHGVSGAGKTTVQDILAKRCGLTAYHPIAPLYRFIYESVMNLDGSGIDMYGYDFKQMQVPGTELTVHNYLVKMWEWHRDADIPVSNCFFDSNLVPLLEHKHLWGSRSKSVSVSSIRNAHEIDWLANKCVTTDGRIVPIIVFNVVGRGIPKPSDIDNDCLLYNLLHISEAHATIENSGTIEELAKLVIDEYDRCQNEIHWKRP